MCIQFLQFSVSAFWRVQFFFFHLFFIKMPRSYFSLLNDSQLMSHKKNIHKNCGRQKKRTKRRQKSREKYCILQYVIILEKENKLNCKSWGIFLHVVFRCFLRWVFYSSWRFFFHFFKCKKEKKIYSSLQLKQKSFIQVLLRFYSMWKGRLRIFGRVQVKLIEEKALNTLKRFFDFSIQRSCCPWHYNTMKYLFLLFHSGTLNHKEKQKPRLLKIIARKKNLSKVVNKIISYFGYNSKECKTRYSYLNSFSINFARHISIVLARESLL